MLKYFISVMLISSTFIGLNAYANSDLIICHEDLEKVEPRRKELALIHADTTKRFNTIKRWLETASRDEITEIWGEPLVNEETIIWVVPLEAAQPVSTTSYRENEKICFTKGNDNRVLIVKDTVKLSTKEARSFRIVGGMATSTAIAERLKKDAK